MHIVTIHQPNFFPWLGYFDKISKADSFVFFDDIQFPKKGGSWSNRIKLFISGDVRWVTAAINRDYSGTRNINEMEFLSNNPWRLKMLKSLDTSYRRYPHFPETMAIIEPLILNAESNIAEYNIHAVTQLGKKLGLGYDKIHRSSNLKKEGSSNELLCSITKTLGGDTYMCGGGAQGYQDDNLFTKRGIKLIYQNFQHFKYPQFGQEHFVPGLSVIDALMNLGFQEVKKFIIKMK